MYLDDYKYKCYSYILRHYPDINILHELYILFGYVCYLDKHDDLNNILTITCLYPNEPVEAFIIEPIDYIDLNPDTDYQLYKLALCSILDADFADKFIELSKTKSESINYLIKSISKDEFNNLSKSEQQNILIRYNIYYNIYKHYKLLPITFWSDLILKDIPRELLILDFIDLYNKYPKIIPFISDTEYWDADPKSMQYYVVQSIYHIYDIYWYIATEKYQMLYLDKFNNIDICNPAFRTWFETKILN